jgi:glycine cleavage system H protein
MKNDRYTKEHEWARKDAQGVYVGVSDYAQKELGDVVFVNLPDVGKTVAQGDSLSTVESVKAVSEIYAPVAGTVVGVNEQLVDKPELINSSAEGEGWIVLLKPVDTKQIEELMTADEYAAYVKQVAK